MAAISGWCAAAPRGGPGRPLQPGNTLHLSWRARLDEHLGNFTMELARARAGDMMESREALAGLNAFTRRRRRGLAGARGP